MILWGVYIFVDFILIGGRVIVLGIIVIFDDG